MGALPGRGPGGIPRGSPGGNEGTGGAVGGVVVVVVVVGAGSVGPGLAETPGCPGRPGGVIVLGLDTGAVAPPVGTGVGVAAVGVVVGVRAGAGTVDDGIPLPPCELGLRRE